MHLNANVHGYIKMITYEFIDLNTNEIIECKLKISELDAYMNSHPTYQRHHSSPVATVRSVPKIPGGFRDVLHKIHERAPGSVLNTNTTGF